MGHSSRSWPDFISLLKEFEIELVVDIRRHPGSRKFPHFNRKFLEENLPREGIDYLWSGEDFGGWRIKSPLAHSPNVGLTAPGFRNYADYMQTDRFKLAVAKMIKKARKKKTVLMCAEKNYQNCHRFLLSDFLAAQGIKVRHIGDHGTTFSHRLTRGAVITEKDKVIYPFPPPRQLDFLS